MLTILHKNSPPCDIAAGPRGESVRGGGDAHRLHQVTEKNRCAELEEGDVIIRRELVILWVEEDAADRSGGCSLVSRGHHTHSHVCTPRTCI